MYVYVCVSVSVSLCVWPCPFVCGRVDLDGQGHQDQIPMTVVDTLFLIKNFDINFFLYGLATQAGGL